MRGLSGLKSGVLLNRDDFDEIYGVMDTPINKLPSISAISELSAVERAAVLDALFEPCVPLHTLSIELLRSKAFTNYDDLVAAIGVQLTELLESSSSSDTVWLDDILRSHPRLGAKKVESAQSQAEQSQLQGEGQEATQLRELNEDYEKKFSGLRYV